MLDNTTIMGIILEPLRLERVPFKSNYAVCLSQSSFMSHHCVNSLKSKVLSRTQGAVQNGIARVHLGLPVVQGLVYKGGRRIECVPLYLGSAD